MIRAVVFDMDGVIVDTEQYWVKAERGILDTALPEDHAVDPHDITGINVHDQYDLLSEKYDLRVDRETYFDLFDRKAEGVYAQADLMPGFWDLLDAIGERGYPLGLATSSYPRWITIVFETHGLSERFDEVLSAANLEGPGKPEPLIYETIAERLGYRPTELLVVEDSETGIAAAARAGAETLAYAPEGTDDQTDRSPADDVLESPGELREAILHRLD